MISVTDGYKSGVIGSVVKENDSAIRVHLGEKNKMRSEKNEEKTIQQTYIIITII